MICLAAERSFVSIHSSVQHHETSEALLYKVLAFIRHKTHTQLLTLTRQNDHTLFCPKELPLKPLTLETPSTKC